MIIQALMWVIVALIALFALVGATLLVTGMREGRERAEEREVPETAPGLRARYARYIGPIDREARLIRRPWLRVAVEFVIALCGFPGLGWLAGGDVGIGLLLLTIGPALTFGFLPVLLALTGLLLRNAYVPVMHLPALAVASAGALAWREVSHARLRGGTA